MKKKKKSRKKRIFQGILLLIILIAVYKLCLQPRIALLTGTKVEAVETDHSDEEPGSVEETTYTIEKKEVGEGEKKITYFVIDIHLARASDLKTAFAHDTFGQYVTDTMHDPYGGGA